MSVCWNQAVACNDASVAEARIEVAEIEARERVVRTIGAAARDDRSHGGFREHVREHPADKEVGAAVPVAGILPDAEHAEIPGAGATGELDARIERQRPALRRRARCAAKERPPALVVDPAELEDVRVLQEERALFREEQVEARQVDLARVGRRAREVRVQRQRRRDRRRRLPEHVERGLECRPCAPPGRPRRAVYECPARRRGRVPCCRPERPGTWPMRERFCVRLKDSQPYCSLSPPCQRVKLRPQASRDGSKESVFSGIAVSAVQPSPSRRAAASQMPSQSQFWRSASV